MNRDKFTIRMSVVAVQGALAMLAVPLAQAQEATVAELTTPTNTVEIGVGDVNKDSYKFGEYNGLQKKGAYVDAGVQLSGGGAYDSNDARRYRFEASNLGLDNRSLTGEYGEQGRYRVTFGYDELRRNRSDSYMTPYLGAGSGTLTLPANWATNSHNCTVDGRSTGNTNFNGASNASTGGTAGCGNYYINQNTTAGNLTASPTGNAAALTAAEVADFSHVDMQTKRKKTDLGFSYLFDPHWQLSVSARHETKDGIQPIGFPFMTTNAQVTIPNPISYTTDQFNLAMAYTGEKAFGQIAYYASVFKDGINSVLVQDPYFSSATPQLSAKGVASFPYPDNGRLGTMPDNQFHQLTLAGGYNLSTTTKLVGNLAYGRSTQNQGYMLAGTGIQAAQAVPQASLDGSLVTKALGLKLTMRPVKDLGLALAYKYDERDNRTASNSYDFRDTDQQIAGPNDTWFNMPYSKKQQQVNADADWRVAKGQNIAFGVESQKLKRWCNNLPDSALCVNSADYTENSGRIEYRNRVLDSLVGRIGYTYANRNASAYMENLQGAPDYLTRFNMTDRKRDKVRSSVTWQANEQFELTAGYDYDRDRYTTGKNPSDFVDSGTGALITPAPALGIPLGLQSMTSNIFNLDASFRISDTVSVNGFYTQEDMKSLLNGNSCVPEGSNAAPCNAATLPATNAWSAEMKDQVKTFGLGLKVTDLMNGRVAVNADYVRSDSSSPYALAAASGLAYSSGATSGTNQALVTAAVTGFPEVFAKSDTIKLMAKYSLDKASAVRVGYVYQKLSNADPLLYNGLQFGAANAQVSGSGTAKVNGTAVATGNVYPLAALMPTGEQAPNYTVQAINVTYVYSFK